MYNETRPHLSLDKDAQFGITAALLRLLERYGAAELDAAIREAIERGVPHPNAVRLALEHRRELRDKAPPTAPLRRYHHAVF